MPFLLSADWHLDDKEANVYRWDAWGGSRSLAR